MKTIKELEKEIECLIKRIKENGKKNYNSMLDEQLGKQMLIKGGRLEQTKEIVKMIEEETQKTREESFLTKTNEDKRKGRLNAYLKLLSKIK